MNKKYIFFFVLLHLCLISKEKSVILNDGTGFFINFCRTLNHIHFCKLYSKTPVVYWGPKCAYYDPQGYNGNFNAWEYYFEPISEAKYSSQDVVRTESYSEKFSVFLNYWQYSHYIYLCNEKDKNNFINATEAEFIRPPWVAPVGKYHVYDERFREYVKKELIDPYIKIKENIQARIEGFYSKNMKGKHVIGIHLRGKHAQGILPEVPIEKIFEVANELASSDTVFYIATDQYPLILEATKQLKNEVIFLDIERSDITTAQPGPEGMEKLPARFGEDVLIEAYLLARCDHFLHTISTVSTSVLYFNPKLKHICFY